MNIYGPPGQPLEGLLLVVHAEGGYKYLGSGLVSPLSSWAVAWGGVCVRNSLCLLGQKPVWAYHRILKLPCLVEEGTAPKMESQGKKSCWRGGWNLPSEDPSTLLEGGCKKIPLDGFGALQIVFLMALFIPVLCRPFYHYSLW